MQTNFTAAQLRDPLIAEANRQAGMYTGKILNGGRPADMPVVQPSKLKLVIKLKNRQDARSPGPDKLLALADEVY
jgi:putative ABC transport system substrate-binding protein